MLTKRQNVQKKLITQKYSYKFIYIYIYKEEKKKKEKNKKKKNKKKGCSSNHPYALQNQIVVAKLPPK
jgi:hypothetical protein